MGYPVTRTVCTESIEEIDNEICTYSYQQKTEATTAKTVEVTFEKQCDTQMVTVSQPTPGYGYHSYGHNYCKEVAQETCYNVPVVTPVEPAVEVEEKCITQLAAPACQTVELTLPKQVCKEINYGYAEDVHEAEPVTYAPEPAPEYAPATVVPAYTG